MSRTIPLVTALAFAGPVAFALSACAALSSQNQDTGYGNTGSSALRACHDEVLRRYGDLRSDDVSTRRASQTSNNYSTRVDWRTRSGGEGNCMVGSDGSIVGFREDRSPYAGTYGSNNGASSNGDYSNNNGSYNNSSDLARAQIEACRNQVMQAYSGLQPNEVQLSVGASDQNQTSVINWNTNRGDTGSCVVNNKLAIVNFNKNRS
jgi:hypothetical protein